MLAQPRVTYLVDAAEEAGIFAITANQPRFDGALREFVENPRSRAPVLDSVKPYILIVKNASRNPIARIVVRHEISYPARSATWTQTLVQIDGTSALEPGASLVVFQGISNTVPGAISATPIMLDHLASKLAQADEVIVILDAVIFDSGLIVGPDKTGAEVQYNSEKRAIRALLHELQLVKHTADKDQALEKLLNQLIALTPRRTLPLPEAARDDTFNYQSMLNTMAKSFVTRGFDLDACIEKATWLDSRMKDLYR